jgi:type IV pilus assembly protein PilB
MEIKTLNSKLKQKKILNAEKLTALETEFNSQKGITSWEDFLVTKKVLSEDQVLQIKSEELGVPIIDLKDLKIDQDVLSLVPEPIANRHKIISFAKEKDELHLAMVDPTDLSRSFK